MKWIRWKSEVELFYLSTEAPCSPDSSFSSFYSHRLGCSFIDCEKDENWREIESGVLDTKTGKLKITLKPVEKVPTLREEVEAFLNRNWGDYREDAEYCRQHSKDSTLVRLVDALDREASTQANPYTKEAVDELLEAARDANDLWFTETHWTLEENKRISRAFIALKKQREAANA